jgi:hypothetical protein
MRRKKNKKGHSIKGNSEAFDEFLKNSNNFFFRFYISSNDNIIVNAFYQQL